MENEKIQNRDEDYFWHECNGTNKITNRQGTKNNVTNTFAERREAKKHQIEVKKTALAKRNR